MPEPQQSNGLDTLVVDPQFSALRPPDQRRALAGVSGDRAFSSLSDDDTVRYVNAHKATLSRDYTERSAAANAPVSPVRAPRSIDLARNYRGFREAVVDPAEKLGRENLSTAGMIAGGAVGGALGGPGAAVLGAGLLGAGGKALQQGLEKRSVSTQSIEELGGAALSGATAEAGGQLIGKVLEAGASLLPRLSRAPAKSAAGFFERGVVPTGISAEDQAVMRENWQRAQKYIAPETRGFPIGAGEGGSMRAAGIAGRAKDNLWQSTVDPVVEMFKDVQRPGDDIGQAIRSSFTEMDKTTRPAAVSAGEKLAQFFEGKPISVGEMADQVKQLNNDRAVSRYYQMSPNEQAQAELADPALRSKVTALSTLREKLFDTIADSGGDRLGTQFREARKDWGALRSIEEQMRQARVPTPQPIATRIGNTLRGSLSPRGPDVWLRGSETLFNLNNPNRLLPKAVNALGRTELNPPMVDIAPQTRGLLGTGSVITPEPGPSAPSGLKQPTATDTRAVRKGLLIPERTGAIEMPPTETNIFPEGLREPMRVSARDVGTGRFRRGYVTSSKPKVIGREGPGTSGGAEVREPEHPAPQQTRQAIAVERTPVQEKELQPLFDVINSPTTTDEEKHRAAEELRLSLAALEKQKASVRSRRLVPVPSWVGYLDDLASIATPKKHER
jgi:hypothetical protein